MEIKKIDEFTQGLLDKFSAVITDKVFLFIESDRELMYEYLHLIAAEGNVSVVNSQIAKAIKKRFNLDNKREPNQEPNQEPNSLLIQSFTEFE